jgi:hypothetical protein
MQDARIDVAAVHCNITTIYCIAKRKTDDSCTD